MYLALYRKYRPLVLADVVSQPHIVDTLRRQISTGKTSHAYLFTGSRGTGKTTCAKILARAVNCENPQNGDPCNACPACESILSGAATDVLEMDAASHSGVDNIRALREEFIYSPVGLKKRVYIIDEVHMLSAGAFNALLKSMEEPPEHVLFILATTELHKVPATIASRCQRFAFRRIAPADIAARLKHIAAMEKIELTGDAADLLSQMADGALRDGISLLDQCAAMSEGFSVDLALVHETLGLSGTLEIVDWIHALADGNAGQALECLEKLYQSGKDLAALLDSLSTLLRDVLLAHMLTDAAASPRMDEATVRALAKKLSQARLVYMITTLQDCQQRLSKSPNQRIEAELCLLRLCGTKQAEAAPAQPVFSPGPATARPATVPAPAAAPVPSASPQSAPPPMQDDDAPPFEMTPPLEEPVYQPPVSTGAAITPPPPAPQPTPSPPAKAPAANSSDPLSLITAKCEPLYTNFLKGATATLTGQTLRLEAQEDLGVMMLKSADFVRFCEELFPGCTLLVEKQADAATPQDRLKQLMSSGGGLISLEDDDD